MQDATPSISLGGQAHFLVLKLTEIHNLDVIFFPPPDATAAEKAMTMPSTETNWTMLNATCRAPVRVGIIVWLLGGFVHVVLRVMLVNVCWCCHSQSAAGVFPYKHLVAVPYHSRWQARRWPKSRKRF